MNSGAMKKEVTPQDVDLRRKATKRAKGLLGEASVRCGDESIDQIVVPTIERIVNGQMVDGLDVAIVQRPAEFGDAGVVRVLRADSAMAWRLRKLRIEDELIRIALRFSKSFEAARLGGLTANYDGVNPNGGKVAEASRWLMAMDELSKACHKLDSDERVVLFGYVLFDLSAADLGDYVARSLTSDKEMHIFTGKLLLNKALIKLALFYEDWDFRLELASDIRF